MTRPSSRLVSGLVGLFVALFAATACSGSPSTAADSPVPRVTSARPTPRTDPGNDANSYKDAATIAKRADDLLGTGDCIQTGAIFSALIAEPAALAAGGTSPEKIDQFKRDIESLKPQIPDQLQADMSTLATAYEQAASGLADFGDLGTIVDPGQLVEKTKQAQDALQLLQNPAVKAAEQHLTDYFRDCSTKVTRPAPG
jgi:hypothetical protein